MSADLFRKRLVSSGLLSEDDLLAFFKDSPATRRPADATGLARLLIRAGKLTEYQARQLMQGNTKSLVFGNYVALEKIGEGGMGVVLKARHQRMDRIVAVKVLPEKALKSADAVDRFYREVKAAARLSHPNIVTAHDAGEHDGTHYFVMEYVEGQDLAHVGNERGPLPVTEAIGYIVQAAKGLEYAHKQGIVHRDIKPANLLLDESGTVKILDMGLARFEHRLGEDESAPLTHSGQVMGTCGYMAPEQAEDTHRADHRADLYSLGCSLYRLLTDRSMYSGDTLVQILLAHRDQPIPSLRAVRPDVSEQLDSVYQKMVAKRPEHRYQSMTESIAALESCLHAVPAAAGNVPTATYQAGEKSDSHLKTYWKQFSPGGETIRSQVEMETGGDPPLPSSWPASRHAKPQWLVGGISASVVLLITLGLGVLWSKGPHEQVASTPTDTGRPEQESSDPVLFQQESERLTAKMAETPAESMESAPEPAEPAAASPEGYAPLGGQLESEMQPEPPLDVRPAQPDPSPAPEENPLEVARRNLLEKQRAVDTQYAAAMKPVEEKVVAWDFAAAWQASEAIQFDEPALMVRLEARRDEIRRMELLKRRIIDNISQADPPLKKSDLKIRGIGGEITDAGPAGLTTKTIRGEAERLTWNDLGTQAPGKLMELVVDPANAEDCIAAGLLAFASGDRAASERLFAQAKAAGADISAQLAAVAASTLAEANELLSQNEFSKAVSLLENLESKYAGLPWLVTNRETKDAALAAARKGVREQEAEALFAEAVKFHKEEALFDLRDAVERLKNEYADCRPVTEAGRTPSVAELEQAVSDLGTRLTVRLDGKGDFTSIQAAIDAAKPNSLIEIWDNGPYNERIVLSEEKSDLTLRGGRGCWPIITSSGPTTNFPVLVSVLAPNTTIERMLLLHTKPAGNAPHALLVGASNFQVRLAIVKMNLSGFSLETSTYNWPDTSCHAESCLLGETFPNGMFHFQDCVFIERLTANCAVALQNCTVVQTVSLSSDSLQGAVILDSILNSFLDGEDNLSNYKGEHRVERCLIANPSKLPGTLSCFASDPRFRDPANLDFRLMPDSPCIGKASDGGDIGCRYTPEMLELCRIASELRAKGVITF